MTLLRNFHNFSIASKSQYLASNYAYYVFNNNMTKNNLDMSGKHERTVTSTYNNPFWVVHDPKETPLQLGTSELVSGI